MVPTGNFWLQVGLVWLCVYNTRRTGPTPCRCVGERETATHTLTTAHTRLVPTTCRDIHSHTERIRKNHLIKYAFARQMRHNDGYWYVIKLWASIICLEISGPVGLRFCVSDRSGVDEPPFSWPLAAARERESHSPGFYSELFSQISAVNFGGFSPK